MDSRDVKVLVGDKLVDATPELVAEMFASMGSDEQAAFFNHVAKVASTWRGGEDGEWAFAMQLQWITDEDGLTYAGRRVMQHIGEYSHWGLVPQADLSFLYDE